ncbi:Na(+)/H(+) exchange regulatory cofactor NHE-RF4 [Bombina bombina]|uniref:Na(+)/H(+) exchange regulatory cofactor NHE-RF4 n=1 Tax=Bombina bombina TaxID=8345 RepID=UPI00235B1A53|nr:Na(+)/H(+) exchange regulatory cofactor NHE-RF4 [Bombina bombina]
MFKDVAGTVSRFVGDIWCEVPWIEEDFVLTTFTFNPKLGIDNPALCLGDDTETESQPEPRFCVLRKDANGSYGFHLRKEVERDGHIVRLVVPGGSAYLGGLRDGDQLLQINGEYVHDQEHLRVVQKVKASVSRLSLCVLDEAAYGRLRSSHASPASILPNLLPETCPRPKLCQIKNAGRGFGFTTSVIGGVRGTFLMNVEEGGPAHRAGVPNGARLLEVNGESITSITMSQLSKKLQKSAGTVVVLVLETSAWETYESCGITPTSSLADTSSLPYQTRKLHMVRCPEGYGFLLRQEKCVNGQGQFLRELDPGLPAELSGMHEGDRLLGVNGQSIEDLEHEDIVSLIQESGNQVTLIVISNEGDRFYSEIGLSPLLFYEDDTSDQVTTGQQTAPTGQTDYKLQQEKKVLKEQTETQRPERKAQSSEE